MPTDREKATGQLTTAAKTDAAGLVGFFLSLPSAGAAEGTVSILAGFVEIAEGSALAITIASLGGIAGGLAIGGGVVLATLAVMSAVSDDSRIGDIGNGASAVGSATSTGTLLLTPLSPAFSPPGQPFLMASTYGPDFDVVTGMLGAGSLGEALASSIGFEATISDPEYQQGSVDLQNYWSGQGSSNSPSGTGASPAGTAGSGGGMRQPPFLYPFAPGLGDLDPDLGGGDQSYGGPVLTITPGYGGQPGGGGLGSAPGKGDEGTGDESTGKESSDDTGKESSDDTGKESSDDTGKESSDDTGKESSDDTGKESSDDTGKESSDDTGYESTGYEGPGLLGMVLHQPDSGSPSLAQLALRVWERHSI